MHRVAESCLILGEAIELIEAVSRSCLPENGRQRSTILRAAAGGAIPVNRSRHQHRQRVGQRRIGSIGDLVEFAAMKMIVEHRGEVLGNARHPPRTERFDTGLLDRFENAARACGLPGISLRCTFGSWQASLSAIRNRHGRGQRRRRASSFCAAGSGNLALPGDNPGRSAANDTSSSGFFAIARRHAVTERLNGSVGASFGPMRNLLLDVLIVPS